MADNGENGSKDLTGKAEEEKKNCEYSKEFLCSEESKKRGCPLCIALQNRDMVNANYKNIITILRVVCPQAFKKGPVIETHANVDNILKNIFKKH